MENNRWILPIVLAVALVFAGVWGYNEYQQKNDYKVMLNNEYQRLFYDMKDNIENVQVSLSKALLSKSREQNVVLLSQIWQQSMEAQEKLSQLPIRHKDLSKTQKFLNQVGDYAFALLQEHLDGKSLSSKQRQSLFQLQDYTAYLSKELTNIHNKLMTGKLNFNAVRRREDKELDKTNEKMLDADLTKFEEKISNNYPELIYDGPFADQVLKVKPRGLGKGKVNANQAKEIASNFIGSKKTRKITSFEEGQNMKAADIQSYTFSIAPENEEKERAIYISVSKTGGKVVWMVNPRPVNNPKISVKEAEKNAKKFLDEKGYKNMEPNYSLKYDGIALFNFAYKEDDVTVYADNIKVKVALDNGEIVGFDAAAYLKSHYDRDIPEPKITEEEAREKVRDGFNIENIRLAMIPLEGIKEVLCYEFKGKYKGADFIIYINALNGEEEKILKVIRNENGTLMI
ncbi:germination protein YpeB [Thermohalobacter berrensis]|uniref:Germination protein YpeB n=1 Tax=Thermohalobacter berrensis TaxID=99594 RepID=A0A419T7N3_9FIRM|nr:germination protein YpeB [Thermohalobacter berrensis]RKD33481.1 germination protein YpeB [Thermohalobacter berrensis]